MSENSSEYLKRTCLICGCHTNQTINIYEPRSGPNIVQLIQAKFKFQPLNEDKYLCFSCNNWLINWHSLQALNSNDAESPSGTFRSHLNSGNVMQDEKSSGSKKPIAICRPIAHVKPRQLVELEGARLLREGMERSSVEAAHEMAGTFKSLSKPNFNKRHFRLQLAKRGTKMQLKSIQRCSCGKYMVVRTDRVSTKSFSCTSIRCRKCRELSHLKACYLRSIVQVEKELTLREPPLPFMHSTQTLVNETATEAASKSQSIDQQQQHPQTQSASSSPQPQQQQPLARYNYLAKPTVDGKIVSMLRRLGTTLSREPQENGREYTVSNTLPQIMSPPKPKTKWLRPLEDDEILVNFDSSISEVLPSLTDQFTHVNTLAVKKCQTFQVPQKAEVTDPFHGVISECAEVEQLTEIDTVHEQFTDVFNLPNSLQITLIQTAPQRNHAKAY